MEKKSQFIEDVEAYAKEMGERLNASKEGGIIIVAVDEEKVLTSFTGSRKMKKEMLIALFLDDSLEDVINEIVR